MSRPTPRRALKMRLLLTLSLPAVAAGYLSAQPSSANASVIPEEVVVVATRTPSPASGVAGTVTRIDEQQIQRTIAQDAREMLRYEPGIEVPRAGSRFGASGFEIRGVGGNRVITRIDGVPVTDSFSVGDFSNATRNTLNFVTIDSVEILRGPASTLYGSRAIGGVVAISTISPHDLTTARQDWHAGVRSSYSGADDGWLTQIQGALTGEHWGILASIGNREADGNDASALEAGVVRDGTDKSQDSFYLRAEGRYDWGSIDLIADRIEEQVRTHNETLLGSGRRFGNTTTLTGDDERDTLRLSAALELDSGLGTVADFSSFLLYYTDSDVDQLTVERRELTPPVQQRRQFDYRQQVWGGEWVAWKNLGGDGTLKQRLAYGVELNWREVEESRDAIEINLNDGSSTTTLLGEAFPVRDFPITDIFEAGLFVQDEISWANGRWRLIPGLRLDYYEVSPERDSLYDKSFADQQPVSIEETSLSPKLGVVWNPDSRNSLFAHYAHGFRAPSFADVNLSLDLSYPGGSVRAIPNPDLKSERSDGVELGWRYSSDTLESELVAFYTRYRNFIESNQFIGIDPVSGARLFQSQNVQNAEIYGGEARVSWEFQPRWTAELGAIWIRGEDRDEDTALNSVNPSELVAGLAFAPDGNNTANLKVRYVAAVDRVNDPADELYLPDSAVVVDGYVSSRFGEHLTLRFGVFNLFDETWWQWGDVRNRERDDPQIPELSAPGRHVRAAAALTF